MTLMILKDYHSIRIYNLDFNDSHDFKRLSFYQDLQFGFQWIYIIRF